MESIRNFLKSKLGIAFLILCLSPLALVGIDGIGGGSDPNVVVTVGDQPISTQQYANALKVGRSQLLADLGGSVDASMVNEDALQEQVLNELIDTTLLQQQTEKLGMTLSDESINNRLLQESGFQDENGQFSSERFAFYLQQRGMNKLQLFDEIRQNNSLSQLNNTIVKTAVYPMQSINELIDLQEEMRHVWVHRYAWEDYVDDVTISNEQIEAYYNEHRNDLNSVAMVDLSYILLSPASMDVPEVTEEEVQIQYDDFVRRNGGIESRRVSQILLTGDDAETKANEVIAQLNAGEPFATVAEEYSEDEGSRSSGGDIGTFNPSLFGADAISVEQALQGLGVGDVSEPVATVYGYQIFKVTADDGPDLPSLEDMREQLEADARAYKQQAMLSDTITAINNMATDSVSLEDIAAQEGLTVSTIKDYPKVNNQSLLNQPAVIDAAFDEYNIQEEAVSTSIEVEDLNVWVHPSNYRPIAPLSLAEATPQITAILHEEQARELAYAQAKQLADTVANLSMEQASATFTDLGPVTRQSRELTEIESSVVFSQDTDSDERVVEAQPIESGASVLVMGPIEQQPNQSMPQSIRIKTAMLVRDNKGAEHLEDYLTFLRNTTDIVRNEEVIEALKQN